MIHETTQTKRAQAEVWARQWEGASPQEILAWAAETFGTKLTLACSFGGVSGMTLLDMAVKASPDIRVFYLDTAFLFPETESLKDAAMRRYGIVPLAVRSELSPEEQAKKYGPELWRTDPDLCCQLRKVEPNRRALAGMDAWIAGLRRDQSRTRKSVPPVAWDETFGLYKIAPLYAWSEEDVWTYIAEHSVPVNALHAQGYPSIGCTHCTRPVAEGEEDLRAGRWAGRGKIECGLHLPFQGENI